MWKRELLKNKIYALILIGLGALSILIEYDATFFVFISMIGIPLFFAKENWITEPTLRIGRSDLLQAMNDKSLRKNGEGYSDPTAYEAIKNADKEDEKFHKLLHTLFYLCDLAGFQIQGRIVLMDKETGRIWR